MTDLNPLASPLLDEPKIGLTAAGTLFPGYRKNKHISSCTVFRWIVRGAKAIDGRVVRLEAIRAGNRWLTSAQSVARFVTALSHLEHCEPQPCVVSKSGAATASQILDDLGIK